VLKRTSFMTVIDGVFCLDERDDIQMRDENARRYQLSRLSEVRLWVLIILQTLWREIARGLGWSSSTLNNETPQSRHVTY